jgi:NAD(P)-dependent dehydrogenase (short-subunit alcohol dehydrogenase family)
MTATGPVALVTGASSGIGKAATLALTAAGFQVIGTSRDTSRITAGDGVTLLDLDVSGEQSVSSVVGQVIERFGRIDVLVNNAGLGTNGAAEEVSVAQAQRVFDVNVFGLMRMTKAVLPHVRAQGRGRIIDISSVGGFVPNPFMAVYVGSKHAVEGYSESLDHEVREHGVRVLLVEPAIGSDESAVRPTGLRSQRGLVPGGNTASTSTSPRPPGTGRLCTSKAKRLGRAGLRTSGADGAALPSGTSSVSPVWRLVLAKNWR